MQIVRDVGLSYDFKQEIYKALYEKYKDHYIEVDYCRMINNMIVFRANIKYKSTDIKFHIVGTGIRNNNILQLDFEE